MTAYSLDGEKKCSAKFELLDENNQIVARMRTIADKKLLRNIKKMEWSEGAKDGLKKKET